MIELVSYTHTEHGRWRFAAGDILMRKVFLEREEISSVGNRWTAVKMLSTDGPGRLGLWIKSGFLVNPNEGREILSLAVERYLMEHRIESGLRNLGKEHEPPPGWEEKVLAITATEQAADLEIRTAEEARAAFGAGSDLADFVGWLVSNGNPVRVVRGVVGQTDSRPVMQRGGTMQEIRNAELVNQLTELTAQRDRIAGEKADLKAEVARLRDEISRLRGEISRLKAKVTELEAELESDARVIQGFADNQHRVTKERNGLQAKVDDLQRVVDKLGSDAK